MYHLFSSPSGLPGPFQWQILAQSSKSMEIKHLLFQTILRGIVSEKCLSIRSLQQFSYSTRNHKKVKILIKILFTNKCTLLSHMKMLKRTVKISHVCSYMFRSTWTIFRQPMPNLAKVTILWN